MYAKYMNRLSAMEKINLTHLKINATHTQCTGVFKSYKPFEKIEYFSQFLELETTFCWGNSS